MASTHDWTSPAPHPSQPRASLAVDAAPATSPAAARFKFIAIKDIAGIRDQETSRAARSHAARHAAQLKGTLAGGNKFRVRTSDDIALALRKAPGKPRRRCRPSTALVVPVAISAARLDPFCTLAADDVRLRFLLGHRE